MLIKNFEVTLLIKTRTIGAKTGENGRSLVKTSLDAGSIYVPSPVPSIFHQRAGDHSPKNEKRIVTLGANTRATIRRDREGNKTKILDSTRTRVEQNLITH